VNKIRKGDEVAVLTGKDKGKRGTVLRVDGDVVVVEGINRVKKHVRPNPMKGEVGGIVEKEMPIQAPMLQCSMPRPRRLIASASRCSKMAARCASSSPTAK
jgi:ribosomal protein L24